MSVVDVIVLVVLVAATAALFGWAEGLRLRAYSVPESAFARAVGVLAVAVGIVTAVVLVVRVTGAVL